jgi:ATP-binding cassette subfamily B protein
MKVLNFILKTVWPFRFYFVGPFGMIIIYSLDLSLRPFLTKLLVDTVSTKAGNEAAAEMGQIIFAYILILFAVPIGWRIYDWCCLKYEPALKGHIARIMVNRLTLQSHNFFNKNFAGSIANKVNDTIKYVPELVTLAINSFIMNFVSIAVAIYALWSIHFWFAIAMSSWALIFISMSIFVVAKFSDFARSSSEASSKVVGIIVDILANISSVRFFSARDYENEKLDDVQAQYTRAISRKRWFSLKFYLIQSMIFAFYQSICLIMLVYLYTHFRVTPGDFAMLLSINMSIVNSLWHLSDEMRNFSEYWGTVEQAIKILESPIQIREQKNAEGLIVKEGKIQFDNVTFHHTGDKPLFQNLNLTIKEGEKVGLVGYSGSGKTTFVNLILRLYDVNDGSIKIDNQDIKEVTLDSLRKSISIIPQDTALFHRTILDNIRYGNFDATDEEVIEAAKKASAHGFITSLPKGYFTHSGEKAIKLSTGQRQRIAIARAVLKNSPILIMDEGTSSLDPITENLIQTSLQSIISTKTTIIIAHRLSTLNSMDRILVFDKGKIIQDGSPAELLKDEDGLFKKLWSAHTCGILPTNDDN